MAGQYESKAWNELSWKPRTALMNTAYAEMVVLLLWLAFSRGWVSPKITFGGTVTSAPVNQLRKDRELKVWHFYRFYFNLFENQFSITFSIQDVQIFRGLELATQTWKNDAQIVSYKKKKNCTVSHTCLAFVFCMHAFMDFQDKFLRLATYTWACSTFHRTFHSWKMPLTTNFQTLQLMFSCHYH